MKRKLPILLCSLLIVGIGCKQNQPYSRPGLTSYKGYVFPAEYRLIYDTSHNDWLATFHFGDADYDVYLFPMPSINMVAYMNTLKYARHFPTADSAVSVIKEHWREILQDRASHPQSKKQ